MSVYIFVDCQPHTASTMTTLLYGARLRERVLGQGPMMMCIQHDIMHAGLISMSLTQCVHRCPVACCCIKYILLFYFFVESLQYLLFSSDGNNVQSGSCCGLLAMFATSCAVPPMC
jgi:hypothetical protein